MNEEELAKKLCDAIDALLRGEEPEAELDDQELIELLQVARLRHQASKVLADAGLTYQELLRRVLQARMASREVNKGATKEVDDPPPEARSVMDEDPKEFLDPLDPDYGKLLNFLDFQRGTAHAAPAVQTRSRTQTVVPRWLRRSERRPSKEEALSAALDQLISSRKRVAPVGDPDIDELAQVAQLRRFVGQSLAAVGSPYKRRLWTVLQIRLAASLRRQSRAPSRPSVIAAVSRLSWRQAAAAAAVIALLLAALGPLPATGFAEHPITHLFELVGQHVGVDEVDAPPHAEIPLTAFEEVIAPEEAAERLGFTVRQPSYLPEGFQLARSSYHPQSVTSPEQGMSALIYTIGGVDPTTLANTERQLIIYQDRASAGDVVWVQTGQAEDVLVGDSLPGTYAHAVWAPGEQGTLEGADPSMETVIFEADGVRVTMIYRNGDQEKEELLRIAESMLA
jgi:hypothetical protein